MSHFTCAVFTHGIPCSEEIDDKLLPYVENCCAEPPREFMEWNSLKNEYTEKYENDIVLGAFDFAGNFVSKYDEKFTLKTVSTKRNITLPDTDRKRNTPNARLHRRRMHLSIMKANGMKKEIWVGGEWTAPSSARKHSMIVILR